MKKLLFVILIVCLVLCGCGKETAAGPVAPASEIPEPAAVPAPEPTPVVILGETVTPEQLEQGYSFELFGQEVNTRTTTELNYKKVSIGDDGLEKFREVLPYMENLTYLTFDRCDTSDEAVAALREEFPDANIAWRIFFAPFSCMTDVEKIWASCDLRDDVTEPLKYCNKVKYLDIGHNAMKSFDFIQYMPDLEVLIVSCSDFESIEPIRFCQKLIFFEAGEDTRVKDFSPIADVPGLKYLNIGGNNQLSPEDLQVVFSLDDPERIFIENYYNWNIDMKEFAEEIQAAYPDCQVSTDWHSDGAMNGLWRYNRGVYKGGYTEMYQWIRDIFEYENDYGSTRLYDWD